MTALRNVGPGRVTTPLLVLAALFVAAGGYVHLREWIDLYRHVSPEVTGSEVVRIGFPLNAAVSLVAAGALVFVAVRGSRFAPHVVAATGLFQIASLTALILTRTGSFLGWSESGWSTGANQSRAVEIGALVCLGAVVVVAFLQRDRGEHRSTHTVGAGSEAAPG